MRGLFFASFIKYVDAFSYCFNPKSDIEKHLFSALRKSADMVLKNHYIFPNKTSINKDKNTDKRQVCNQQ